MPAGCGAARRACCAASTTLPCSSLRPPTGPGSPPGFFGTGPGWSLCLLGQQEMPDGESIPKGRRNAASQDRRQLLRRGRFASASRAHLIYLPWQQCPWAAAGPTRAHGFCHKTCHRGHSPAIHLRSRCRPSRYTWDKITITTLMQKSKPHMPERWLSWNQMRLVSEVEEEPTPPTHLLCLSQ